MIALCACLVRKSRFHKEYVWQKSIKAINFEQNRTITEHRKKGDCGTNRSIIHSWHVIALCSYRWAALLRISHTRGISWIQYRLPMRARSEGNDISPGGDAGIFLLIRSLINFCLLTGIKITIRSKWNCWIWVVRCVTMRSTIFRDVMPCTPVELHLCFGRTSSWLKSKPRK